MTNPMPASLLRALPDARLADLVVAGHDRAFEVLVNRHRSELLRHCRRLRLSDAAAEDVVQHALMSAWAALRRGSDVREPRAWLHRIVHHEALRALSVRDTPDELSEAMPGPGSLESWVETRATVHETLCGIAALPAQQRDALLGTAAVGMSHEQLATQMGLTPQAVRGLVYRARATMRAGLAAVIPAPLLNWMLGQSNAAVAGAGGGAGLVGLLLKGGAAGVAAVVLATAAGAGHTQTSGSRRPSVRAQSSRVPTALVARSPRRLRSAAPEVVVFRPLQRIQGATVTADAAAPTVQTKTAATHKTTSSTGTQSHAPTFPTLSGSTLKPATKLPALSLKTLVPAVIQAATPSHLPSVTPSHLL
jgi:RNA polymerase sigma factor (sigma-70 family)